MSSDDAQYIPSAKLAVTSSSGTFYNPNTDRREPVRPYDKIDEGGHPVYDDDDDPKYVWDENGRHEVPRDEVLAEPQAAPTCRHGKRIGYDCGLCELQGPDDRVAPQDAREGGRREVPRVPAEPATTIRFHRGNPHIFGAPYGRPPAQIKNPQDVLIVLPDDPKARKRIPIFTGLLDYFPAALAEIAQLSVNGNDQHNPGQELHWARDKSSDHADTIGRHMMQRGTRDTDGVRHMAKAAWRALALLQEEIEWEQGFVPAAAEAAERSEPESFDEYMERITSAEATFERTREIL